MSNWRGKSLWSVSSRFVGAGLSFLLNVELARSLSQDDLGQFFLFLSLSWAGAIFCQWGTSFLAVKWVATARAKGDRDSLRTSVWSLTAFTVFQSFVVATLIALVLDLPRDLLIVWASWTVAVSLQSLSPELLRGFDDLKWASLLTGPVPQFFSASLVGIGWLFWGTLSFHQAAVLVIAANLLCALIGFVLVARRAPPTLKLARYSGFFKESTPFALSLGATFLLAQADLWVCGLLLSKENVAVYGIAQRFVLFVSMPMMILASIMTPTMAELLAVKDQERLRRVLSKGAYLTSILTALVYVGGVTLGYPVIRFLFGDAYSGAYALFCILGAGQLLHAFAGLSSQLLLLAGEQKAAMRATLVAVLILLIGAWSLGQLWGPPGIAAANAIAVSVQTLWTWMAVRNRLKINTHFSWKRNETSQKAS